MNADPIRIDRLTTDSKLFAEHHFRVHSAKMEAFHHQIAELQKQEGTRVINHTHLLGFLDSDLSPRGQPAAVVEGAAPSAP